MAVHKAVTFRRGTPGRFALVHGIGFQTKRVARNPYMADDPWSKEASHYRIRLTKDGREYSTYYSMGAAHMHPPDIDDVLMTLAHDAIDYENAGGDLEEYAVQFGLDPDEPWVRRSFEETGRQTAALFELLGEEVFAELLALSEEYQW